jgi:hypothetical protein
MVPSQGRDLWKEIRESLPANACTDRLNQGPWNRRYAMAKHIPRVRHHDQLVSGHHRHEFPAVPMRRSDLRSITVDTPPLVA